MRSRALSLVLAFSLASFAQKPSQTNDPEPTNFDCHLITSEDLIDPSAPAFRSFPADASASVGRAALDISNPIARKYRTVIRQQMRLGPNFAGHYRVAIWGCGSSCNMFAVIDLESGGVITPSNHSVSGVRLAANDFLPDGFGDGAWGFRFRKDSRMLVLVGSLNEDEDQTGAFYYVLANGRLKLIHSTHAKGKNCPSQSVNQH